MNVESAMQFFKDTFKAGGSADSVRVHVLPSAVDVDADKLEVRPGFRWLARLIVLPSRIVTQPQRGDVVRFVHRRSHCEVVAEVAYGNNR